MRVGDLVSFRPAGSGATRPAIVTASWGEEPDQGPRSTVPPLSGPEHVHLTVFTPSLGEPTGSRQVHDVAPDSGAGGRQDRRSYVPLMTMVA